MLHSQLHVRSFFSLHFNKKILFKIIFTCFFFSTSEEYNKRKKTFAIKKISVVCRGGGVEVDMGSVKDGKKCKLGKKTILRWKLKKEEKSTVIPRYYFILAVSFYPCKVTLSFLSLMWLSNLTSENRTKGVDISNLSLCLNSLLNRILMNVKFLKIHLLHRTFRLN
jgi:hypothetical protein